MNKFIMSVVFFVVSFAALADIPKPSQIEQTLSDGNYGLARQEIAQVLAVHPESPRAHLINAFIMEHADHNKLGAKAELDLVRSLDNDGKIVNSELYNRTKLETDALSEDLPKANIVVSSGNPTEHHGFWFYLLVFGVSGLIIYGLYWIFTNSKNVKKGPDNTSSRNSYPITPTLPSGSSNSLEYHNYSHPDLAQHLNTTVNQVHTGPSALETGASVAAGVVAGELITDAIRRNERDTWDNTRNRRKTSDDSWTNSDIDKVDFQEENYEYSKPIPSKNIGMKPGPVDTWSSGSGYNSSTSSDDSWSSSSSSSSSDSWGSSSSSSSDSWSSSDSGSSSSDSW